MTRLLVAYSGAATHVSTTVEYLSSLKQHSACEVSYLHVTDNAQIDVDLNQFDAVFNSYCARLCFPGYVSQSYLEALRGFRGVRLIAVQDEYEHTNALRRAIRDIGFHVVFTCVPRQSLEFVYPRDMFPETEFVTVLTGYVPEFLKAHRRSWTPLARRPIVIGYRGRQNGGHLGRLGYDKYEIGQRMCEICRERGIRHDIETSDEKRIYGEAWYDFLGQCRSTLGTESGSNVFDFDGALEARYQAMTTDKGGPISYEEFQGYTDPHENEVPMGQISPRIFEAAATGTPLILFSGRYSGIINPGEHYIELKKDFSNIDNVLDQIEDISALEALADRSYRHLVQSGNYDYSRFVETVDELIERMQRELATAAHATVPHLTPALDLETEAHLQPFLKERPTRAPKDAIHHRSKQLCVENEALKREVKYLRSEFASETGRLSKEINFLRSEFTSETERLLDELESFKSASAGQLILRSMRTLLLRLIDAFFPQILSPLRSAKASVRRCCRGARSP